MWPRCQRLRLWAPSGANYCSRNVRYGNFYFAGYFFALAAISLRVSCRAARVAVVKLLGERPTF